jgi:hypothetical protein
MSMLKKKKKIRDNLTCYKDCKQNNGVEDDAQEGRARHRQTSNRDHAKGFEFYPKLQGTI